MFYDDDDDDDDDDPDIINMRETDRKDLFLFIEVIIH